MGEINLGFRPKKLQTSLVEFVHIMASDWLHKPMDSEFIVEVEKIINIANRRYKEELVFDNELVYIISKFKRQVILTFKNPVIIYNGIPLDPRIEHEISSRRGMYAFVRYRHDSHYHAEPDLMTDLTEFHWKYNSPLPTSMAAFEMKTTGFTRYTHEIESVILISNHHGK